MSSVIKTFISVSSIVGSFLSPNPDTNGVVQYNIPSFKKGGDTTDYIILVIETNIAIYKLAFNNSQYLAGNSSNYLSYYGCILPNELLNREHLLYDDFIPIYKSTCRLLQYLTSSIEGRQKLYKILANTRAVEEERNTTYGIPPNLPDISEQESRDNSSRMHYLPHKVCFRAACRISHRLACMACIPIAQLTNACIRGLRSSKRLKKMIYSLEDYISGNTDSFSNSNIEKVPNIFLPENLEKHDAAKNELNKYLVIIGKFVYENQESENSNNHHHDSIQGENQNVLTNRKDLENMAEFANCVYFEFLSIHDKTQQLAIRDPTEVVPDLSNNIYQLKNRIKQCEKAITMVKSKLNVFKDPNEEQSEECKKFLDMIPEALDRVSSEMEKNIQNHKSAREILDLIGSISDNLLILENTAIPGTPEYKMPDSIRALIQTFYKQPLIQICEYHEHLQTRLGKAKTLLRSYYLCANANNDN